MSRGGAHFTSEELVRVLSHYDVGVIHQAKAISAGNRRAPKVALVSGKGKFLLKHRPRGKDDLDRVGFAHTIQLHLSSRGFPVPPLVRTRDDSSTVLHLDNHLYELFRFVSGSRYDGSPKATTDTGRQLARFHRHLAGFEHDDSLSGGSFHDSASVRRHLRTIGSRSSSRVFGQVAGGSLMSQGRLSEKGVARALMAHYNDSSVRVNALGYESWREQVVHGDWHPGNMLFERSRVIAVLDFDLVKIAPPITDVANALLQFSIVGGRPNPADWPDYFDQDKLVQLLGGYRQETELEANQIESLVDLMIETMIAEAVLPIAATGFFGHLSGQDFLKMILRKARWLDKNRQELNPHLSQL